MANGKLCRLGGLFGQSAFSTDHMSEISKVLVFDLRHSKRSSERLAADAGPKNVKQAEDKWEGSRKRRPRDRPHRAIASPKSAADAAIRTVDRDPTSGCQIGNRMWLARIAFVQWVTLINRSTVS